MVQVGGLPFKSCIMLAMEAAGQSVTTIEGLKRCTGYAEIEAAIKSVLALQS
jgi:aerobic-type carbon monoxide dehydrogenase small subunit (CoxS/CutS family)